LSDSTATPTPTHALADVGVLLTPRLRLRAVTEDDLPALMAVNGDDEVTRFLPYASWREPQDGAAWLGRMRALEHSGQAQQLVMARADDDVAIGTALLFRWEPASRRLELGYALGRAHWGQGLAQEALASLLAQVFAGLGVNRVEAEVDTANLASNALLRRLGFRHEGVLRQRWQAKGRCYDVNAWGLLASD
jgi:RimJ/RimL family protein N-acetyltransferase